MILCQVGGGQDGAGLAEAFAHVRLPEGAHGVLLAGPYLPVEVKARIRRAMESRPRLRIARVRGRARSVCSAAPIGSSPWEGTTPSARSSRFEKPALIVPRVHPRREQWIRAERLRAARSARRAASRRPDPRRAGPLAGAQTDPASFGPCPVQLERTGNSPPVAGRGCCRTVLDGCGIPFTNVRNHPCYALTPSASVTS